MSGSQNDCLISIDSTNCPIPQQGKAVQGNAFALHKFAGKSALHYELGVDIAEGDQVWIEGPYPVGKYPDINIFWQALLQYLDPFD
jgi:hypothetical protein